MATLGYIKDGVKGKVDLMPNSYPAEKVTYDNTTSGLTADDVQDAIDELAASSGGGHEILNPSGTAMNQEDKLQFTDAFVSDDSVNSRTVVENVKEHSTKADYDNATEDGFHVIDDGNDALIGAVSDDIEEVTGNGSKTYATLLNELYIKIDKSKLTPYSKIVMISQYGTMQFDVVFYTNSNIVASQSNASASDLNTDTAILSSASTYYQYRNGSSQDTSSTVLNNGGTITLYYGNKKATVDLQTTANRCLLPDGETTVADVVDCDKTTAGTYALKCTVDAQGNKTYLWV